MKIPSRSGLLRIGAAIQACLLLVTQLVDGSGVHRCPDHDAGVGILVVEMPSAHGHHSQDHSPRGGHEGFCPCLGACHHTAVALAPAGTAQLVAAPSHAVATTAAPVATPRGRVAHLLPFAVGPPDNA